MATAAEIPLIARQYDLVETSLNVVVTTTQLCKADSQRVALGLAQPSGSGVVISTRPNMTGIDSTSLPTSGGILWFTFSDVGSLCQQAFYGSASGPSAKCIVFEVFYRNR